MKMIDSLFLGFFFEKGFKNEIDSLSFSRMVFGVSSQ